MELPAETTATTRHDPESWVEEYGDAFYRYAMSRLRDPDAAEEVVQQTLVSGLEHQDQFAGSGSQQGWLMGILNRKIIDLVRARGRVSQSETLDTSDPMDHFFDRNGSWKMNVRETLLMPLDSVDQTEFWPVFNKCLAELSEKQSGVFTMREMEDIDSAEICKELEVTASNLWVLLHRARIRLASCIKLRWLQENS